MFWGCSIKKDKTHNLVENSKDREDDMLHVSKATLDSDSEDKRAKVYVSNGKKSFLIASLIRDKCENVNLDHYFKANEEVIFKVIGNAKVHLTGYWEPSNDLLDDDLGMNMPLEMGEEEGDFVDPEEYPGTQQVLDQAEENRQLNSMTANVGTKDEGKASESSDESESEEKLQSQL